MKRLNNIYETICTAENIEKADNNARKKKHNWGIIKHDRHKDKDNRELLEALKTGTYKTSEYTSFKAYDPKERIIYRLPYYPDRIAQWSILNILGPIWTKIFIENTYACIKGRGIHKLCRDLRKVLNEDVEGTKYCLKLDIRKFYPSIDHDCLKGIIRRKIKDKGLLATLDEIIDSIDGVPIGNYLSQFFANLYLAYFDHWVKEELKVRYYFRYADDMIILSDDKEKLKRLLVSIKIYLKHVLKLEVKGNYQVFPVDSRGIDIVGYVFYHDHTMLRKRIKKRIYRVLNKWRMGRIADDAMKRSMACYFGWMKHCNSKHLLQKISTDTGLCFSDCKGINVPMFYFRDKIATATSIEDHDTYFRVNLKYNNKLFTVTSTSSSIKGILNNSKLPVKLKFY